MNLIEFKNDSSLDWGPGLFSISPPSKINNNANTPQDNFSLIGVKCKEEKVGALHRLLLRFVNERIVKNLPSYCTSCCKYISSSNSTASLLNKEFSLNDINHLQVSI